MNILIIGASGQLGNALYLQTVTRHYVLAPSHLELDVTDSEAVERYIDGKSFDVIVNCAAYTQVDMAESEPEVCDAANHIAVKNLAMAACGHGAKFLHISTDYVFEGNGCVPYGETDAVNPQSVYGKSKLNGEIAAMEYCEDSIIIRTSWLYSAIGKNFVKTMLRLADEHACLNVVFDQIGSPTYAPDLADAMVHIIDSGKWEPGIYHYSDEGVASWYDFAEAIFRISGKQCDVLPVLSAEYPTKAVRPKYSVLDKSKIKKTYGLSIPYWYDSLEKCINEINSK